MKTIKIASAVLVALVVAVALGAWTTYDYNLQCTKCLADRHVVVHRLCGIPFFRSSSQLSSRPGYESIFGQQCQHILRSGGFGRGSVSLFGSRIVCGTTADGRLLRPRMEAVTMTYYLARRLGAHELARDTFALIDRLMPPEARMSRRSESSEQSVSTLFQLHMYLHRVLTVDDWRRVVDCARGGFRETPQLPDP